jgi:hypothetical protein
VAGSFWTLQGANLLDEPVHTAVALVLGEEVGTLSW